MNRIFLMLMMAFITLSVSAQEWKNWEKHDIKRFYVEISEEQAEDRYDAEEFGDRWFVPTKIPAGEYSVEMGEKIESKFWRFKGTKYFALFTFNPFLWKWDEGVLVSDGRNGTFYKKED